MDEPAPAMTVTAPGRRPGGHRGEARTRAGGHTQCEIAGHTRLDHQDLCVLPQKDLREQKVRRLARQLIWKAGEGVLAARDRAGKGPPPPTPAQALAEDCVPRALARDRTQLTSLQTWVTK